MRAHHFAAVLACVLVAGQALPESYVNLVKWVEDSNGFVSPLAPRGSVNATTGPLCLQETPRGLIYTGDKTLEVGETVLSVPRDLVVTATQIKRSRIGRALTKARVFKGVSDKLSNNTLLAVWLLGQQRQKGKAKSLWHVNVLADTTDESRFPVHFGDKHLDMIQGSRLLPNMKASREDFARQYKKLAGVREFRKLRVTEDEFFTALLTAYSRSFEMHVEEGAGVIVQVTALVPLADMLRHSAAPATEWYFDGDRNGFALRTLSRIQPGDEVFGSFGLKTRTQWLLFYGEVPEDELRADTTGMAASYSQAQVPIPVKAVAEDPMKPNDAEVGEFRLELLKNFCVAANNDACVGFEHHKAAANDDDSDDDDAAGDSEIAAEFFGVLGDLTTSVGRNMTSSLLSLVRFSNIDTKEFMFLNENVGPHEFHLVTVPPLSLGNEIQTLRRLRTAARESLQGFSDNADALHLSLVSKVGAATNTLDRAIKLVTAEEQKILQQTLEFVEAALAFIQLPFEQGCRLLDLGDLDCGSSVPSRDPILITEDEVERYGFYFYEAFSVLREKSMLPRGRVELENLYNPHQPRGARRRVGRAKGYHGPGSGAEQPIILFSAPPPQEDDSEDDAADDVSGDDE